MLLAAGPLALWGAWALWLSLSHGPWINGVLGAGALLTAGGLLLLRVWARPLAYLFAATLVVVWVYAVWQVISSGWPYADWSRSALSLVPGALLLVVCAGGVWIVHTQYRARSSSHRRRLDGGPESIEGRRELWPDMPSADRKRARSRPSLPASCPSR